MLPPIKLKSAIDRTVREDWGRILASLVKTLNNFQLAEDCLQDAVISAMADWQKNGLPNSPPAWLITTARRKAIDRIRKDKNFASKQTEIAYLLELDAGSMPPNDMDAIPDQRLEMIFTCCHPALEKKTRVALTLRTLGGLTTEEIASAFLDKPEAIAQRLVRAKKKIAVAGIPYEIPAQDKLPERLASVLSVIYLIFNEGYSASSGDQLVRTDLTNEAIRLARIVLHLQPDQTEVAGLLALMLLHDSRRQARIGTQGELISLEDQNRARWDRPKIAEGSAILQQALPKHRLGPYQLQAAISAVHAESTSWAQTDWSQINALYELLYKMQPTLVVRINHAVAISHAISPKAGLTMLAEVSESKLNRYQPYFVAKADLLTRAGQIEEAKSYLDKAIALSSNSMERDFLNRKAAMLSTKIHDGK